MDNSLQRYKDISFYLGVYFLELGCHIELFLSAYCGPVDTANSTLVVEYMYIVDNNKTVHSN